MTEDMVKKRYTSPFIKVKIIHYHVMDEPGSIPLGSEEEDIDNSRQSKQSSSSFIDYSFDDGESDPFDTY